MTILNHQVLVSFEVGTIRIKLEVLGKVGVVCLPTLDHALTLEECGLLRGLLSRVVEEYKKQEDLEHLFVVFDPWYLSIAPPLFEENYSQGPEDLYQIEEDRFFPVVESLGFVIDKYHDLVEQYFRCDTFMVYYL